MSMRYLAALSLLVLAATACGTRAEPVPEAETSTPSPGPAVEESPVSPPATPKPTQPEPSKSPLPEPEISPIATPSEPAADAVAAAKEHLAGKLDVSPEKMEVVSVEPVEWSDTSLGCPEPGKAYAQVITPGYRILLKVEEKQYEVHTNQSGRAVTICESELERGSAAAVEHLADELGIAPDEIEVLSVERVEWPDTSLGCPEPGKSYAQVMTPGYRVILEAQRENYEVHTDVEGQIVVICEPKG